MSIRSRVTARPSGARSWFWLLLAIPVLGVWGLFTGENSLPNYWRLGRERRELQREVDRLRARQAALERDLDRLDRDPELLERIAREVYHLRRPEEQVLEIVDSPPPGGSSAGNTAVAGPDDVARGDPPGPDPASLDSR